MERRTGRLQAARRPGIVLLAGLGIVVGCGGGSTGGSIGPGNCQVTNPCGGDLTGEWTVAGVCVHRDVLTFALMLMYGQSCPAGAAITLGDATINETGSISFTAAGEYAENVTEIINFAFQLPASCLGGSTCAAFGTQFGSAGECSGDSVCSCRLMEIASREASIYSGTYLISGTTVELTSSIGATSNLSYCVQGNELRLLGRSVLLGADEVLRR